MNWLENKKKCMYVWLVLIPMHMATSFILKISKKKYVGTYVVSILKNLLDSFITNYVKMVQLDLNC